ncbi:LysR substrate-binding domain-containing protein [Agrococcus sp. DT81.2]|uniref:LysR substrate-binding domain-containing protein n=1 Tax=Agrococcus sp. DT81.2 TaxID=3393414 RepID=UPI003CE4518B
MGFTLRQAEVFVAVADTLHFGRAAVGLGISQATASQEVRRLEIALGLTLLQRSTRSVTLTPAGAAVLVEARKLLRAAAAVADRAALFRDAYLNRLRIVASPSAVNLLLPRAIKASESVMPTISIEEVAVESGEVSAEVAARGADVGIGRFLEAPEGYVHETLGEEQLFVALSDSHPLAGAAALHLSQLQDLPLLLWPREHAPRYYDALLRLCADDGLTPLVLVSPPRIVGSRLYLIAEARAFSLVPQSTVPFLPAGVQGVELSRPTTLPLEVIRRLRDPREHVASFLDILRTEAGRLRPAARGGE